MLALGIALRAEATLQVELLALPSHGGMENNSNKEMEIRLNNEESGDVSPFMFPTLDPAS